MENMQSVEVTARFDPQGRATPLSFTLEGTLYAVNSIGRRWEDEAGQHSLVMSATGEVFELVFSPQESRWFLGETGQRRRFA
jgi:hypothetical protein